MKRHDKIKTKVIHSQSKDAWNVVGDMAGQKYKIARIPYLITSDEGLNTVNKYEAYSHAMFISRCFNMSDAIYDCNFGIN